MTKKQEKEFEQLIESRMKEVALSSVIKGFKAAYDCVVEQIDNGMSLEQIREWATAEKNKTEIVEKVKFN